MHGIGTEHEYSCRWVNNSQLQFFVDNTNVGTLSDKRLKTEIKEIDNNLLEAIEEIEIKSFRLNNRQSVVSIGIIAQELIEIFEKYNLDITKYQIISQSQYKLDEEELYYVIDYQQLLILKTKCLENKINKQQKTIDFLINKLNLQDELNNYLEEEL